MKNHNFERVLCALDVFAQESLDVSAKGVLRALSENETLQLNELVAMLAPRDYDIAINSVQLERLHRKLREAIYAA